MSWCSLTSGDKSSAIKTLGYARNDDAHEALSKLRGAFRHPERSEMSDVRSCKGGTVRTESKDLAPHHHSSFLIRAELSSTIKGRHAPRANPAPRFNFLYHTVRDREKQSRERKICIFETSVVEYILRFSVFCKNKRWFNIVGKTDLRRNNFYERKSRGTGSAQGISRH